MTDAPPRPSKFLVVVDDTPEARVALRYATRRARTVGGRVILLRTFQPSTEEAGWRSVAEALRREAREAAEQLLQDLAVDVQKDAGVMPEFVIREGSTRDELLKLIDEDRDIRILVLAAAPGADGPGPLVTALAGQMSGNLHVPVTVVPGSLTDAELERLT